MRAGLHLTFSLILSSTALAETFVARQSQHPMNLSNAVEVLEDAEGHMTLDEVLAGSKLQWKTYPQDIPNFGYTDIVYWVRISIKNEVKASNVLYLELSYPNHDRLTFYHEQSDGTYTRSDSGDSLPYSVREVSYRNFVFKMEIPHGATRTFYLRAQSESSMQFPLSLWTPEAFVGKVNREVYGLGIYYGIMLVIISYNLFFFVWLRNTNYLIYVLYIFCFTVSQAALNGFILEYVWPESPYLANKTLLLSASITCMFGLIFVSRFLQTKENCPRFHWLIRFCFVLSCCFFFLGCFFSYATSIRFGSLTILLTITSSFVASILTLRKGYRPARFFVAAWVSVFIGVCLYHFRNLGIFPTFFVADYGPQLGSAAEVILLSLALADKIKLEQMENQSKIEALNAELADQIRNVEQQVDEKTRDIKSILQNIKQGIFMILPNGFRIHRDHSAHLMEILDRKDIEQANALDLLCQHTQLSADEMNQVKSVLEISLDQDEVNFLSNAHCLPQELIYRSGVHAQEKILSVDWNPIVGQGHKIDKILVTIRDETGLRQLQAQARQHEVEMEYIRQLIEIPQDKFVRFLELAFGYLDQNGRLLDAQKGYDPECIRMLFIQLHTLKGMSRNYGLKQLTDLVHEAEAYLKELRVHAASFDQQRLRDDQMRIREELLNYQRVNTEKLGRRASSQTIEFTLAEVQAMLRDCGDSQGSVVYKSLAGKLYQDAVKVLEKACSRAPLLARDLGKEEPFFSIQAENLAFHQQGEILMENILVHLIRNSLDHGIETREQRLHQGKTPAGTIRMTLSEVGSQLLLRYSDDGRGLHLGRIRAKAVALGQVKAEQNLDIQAIANCIFLPGLSTATQLTDVSGQGVGMDAVRSSLEQVGGSIAIELLETAGEFVSFEFHILIPASLFVSFKCQNVA